MRPIRSMTLALLVGGIAAASAAAHAGPQASSTSADAAAHASDLFKEGMRFVAQQKWAEAETKFLAAFALNPTYDIAANLGQTQYRLGKHVEAAEHLAFALKAWPVVGKKEPREAAERRVEELRKLVASLTIQVSTAGAVVTIDGATVGQAPIEREVFVEPGKHTVSAKLGGYEAATQAVDVAKGTSTPVTLKLAAIAPTATASANVSPPPTATATGRARTGPPPALIIVGGVLAAGGLAAGAGLTVAANGKGSDISALQEQLWKGGAQYPCAGASTTSCGTLRDALASRDALSKGAVAGFVLGSAFALATTGMGLWLARTPKDEAPAQPAVRVMPAVGSGEGGIVVVGAW